MHALIFRTWGWVPRTAVLAAGVVAVLLAVAGTASAAQPSGPSCNGVFSSSAAGEPGHVALAAHFVKELSTTFGFRRVP